MIELAHRCSDNVGPTVLKLIIMLIVTVCSKEIKLKADLLLCTVPLSDKIQELTTHKARML